MPLEHQLSVALRNTGHGHVAAELDRLLNVIGQVHHETIETNGHIERVTRYQLFAIIEEQSVDPKQTAGLPIEFPSPSANWGTVLSLNSERT